MDCKVAAIICAVLLSVTLIQGAAVSRGNRCLCTKFSNKLKIKAVEKLEIYPRSPNCENVEYVAFLKKRNVPICVSPDLKEVKALLKKRKNRNLNHIKVIHHQ
ncbi:C-X-C motif chemokine 10-like [Dendropsophus ebraccatus]|uniref:C-X-C motif chemokine 10-like n=1 Tax=Dendropsophus ebraccatus TaxID=150705 RepID=UPI003831F3BE